MLEANGYTGSPTDRLRKKRRSLLELLKVEWSWREESNLQPAVYKTAALPIELRQHAKEINGLR